MNEISGEQVVKETFHKKDVKTILNENHERNYEYGKKKLNWERKEKNKERKIRFK